MDMIWMKFKKMMTAYHSVKVIQAIPKHLNNHSKSPVKTNYSLLLNPAHLIQNRLSSIRKQSTYLLSQSNLIKPTQIQVKVIDFKVNCYQVQQQSTNLGSKQKKMKTLMNFKVVALKTNKVIEVRKSSSLVGPNKLNLRARI